MDPTYKERLLSKVRSLDPPDLQAVLHSAYDAVVHGRFDEFATFLTEDAQLSIAGIPPLDGVWRGRDAVVAATKKNFGMIDNQQPDIERMVAQGDSVVVLLRERGTFKAEGRAYSVRVVQWFTFENGKISGIDEIGTPLAN
jgi:ketosteroid isomerase-like protein